MSNAFDDAEPPLEEAVPHAAGDGERPPTGGELMEVAPQGPPAGEEGPPEVAAVPAHAEASAAEEEAFRLEVANDLSKLETLLSDDFARVSAERDEFLDALQRLQADFDNYRKRTERQQAELRSRASESLVTRLLPVLDSLELAITHLGLLGDNPPSDEASTSLLKVDSQLRGILAREGLERIAAVGVGFDPTVHEATAMDETGPEEEEKEEASGPKERAGPTVTAVWRSGYRMGERVIRPAMVQVRG